MSTDPCRHCNQTELHTWTEGDCILPHKAHSRRLIDGTHICLPCVERHKDWLREIVDLYATLEDVVLVDSVQDEPGEYQKPRKRPASPSPLRLDAWALLHLAVNDHTVDRDGTVAAAYLGANLPNIPAVLAGWAAALFDLEGWGLAPVTVSGAAAALRANAERWAASPDIDTYDTELAWVRRALRNAHGVAGSQPVGRCPSLNGHGVECGGALWPDKTGRMAVTCARCDRHFGETMLRHLGGMIAS